MNEDKPILVGGIGEINFGKQFRQGNRVYDSNNIAMCLMAQPVGNNGGNSYLYKVNKIKEERGIDMNEFKNETLKKAEWNMPEDMKEIKLLDSFSGIGALHNALKFLGIPTKIIGLSEVDVDAIISYACIHIDNFLDLEFNYPSEEEMRTLLLERNIGWSFEKQKSCIPRLKKDKLYKVYKATILLNNLGDISKINCNDILDFDLFNFSCTDLSTAGKQKGMKNEDGTPTRSGLYVYGMNIIKAKKPKYIMIENVKALIQKKFINDFYDICNEIESYGYKIYYPTKEDQKGNKIPMCLNAKNYGIPQNRERIFVICVRNDCNDSIDSFWNGQDFGFRLKDFLEDSVEEKYYLSQVIQDRFKYNGNENKEQNYIKHMNKQWHFSTEEDMKHDTNEIAQVDDINYKATRSVSNPELYCRTLDTMGGGQREPKTIENINAENTCKYDMVAHETDNKQNFRIRKLTPNECWRLMGFVDEQFDRAKVGGTSDSQLYKQAGNSIVVNCLYYIFKELFKNYINEEDDNECK